MDPEKKCGKNSVCRLSGSRCGADTTATPVLSTLLLLLDVLTGNGLISFEIQLVVICSSSPAPVCPAHP